jgi:hypothetical protein
MRRFFSRHDFSDLEAELRKGRPEPRADFLDELVTRVEPAPARVPARRPRLAAALVFAVVVLVALAAFGGAGYAKSSVVSAAKSSGHAVSAVVSKDDSKPSGNEGQSNAANQNSVHGENGGQNGQQGHNDPPADHQYHHFVLVCYPFTTTVGHRTITVFRTIVVSQSSLGHYVPPGTEGACAIGHN